MAKINQKLWGMGVDHIHKTPILHVAFFVPSFVQESHCRVSGGGYTLLWKCSHSAALCNSSLTVIFAFVGLNKTGLKINTWHSRDLAQTRMNMLLRLTCTAPELKKLSILPALSPETIQVN